MPQANLIQSSIGGGNSNALALQGDGVLLPKLSTTDRVALSLTSSSKGFLVFDSTDNNIYIWNGSAWESIVSSGDTSNLQILFNDNGVISGNANLQFVKTANALIVGGDSTFNGVTIGRGFSSVTTNTAIGNGALSSAQPTSANNTAIGLFAQQFNFTGTRNVCVGGSALSNVLFSGTSNVVMGYQAGDSVTTGSSNIILGTAADTEAAGSSNQISVGSAANYVGTNGGATTWYATAVATTVSPPAGSAGFWRVIINGTPMKIAVYTD